MECEKIDYSSNPEKITGDTFDCIWISFAKRDKPSPLRGHLLPWLDWKLRGQLVKHLLNPKPPKTLTFIPTLNAISTPLLAIIPNGEITPHDYKKNCQGLQLKNILFVSEEKISVPKILIDAARDAKISWAIDE